MNDDELLTWLPVVLVIAVFMGLMLGVVAGVLTGLVGAILMVPYRGKALARSPRSSARHRIAPGRSSRARRQTVRRSPELALLVGHVHLRAFDLHVDPAKMEPNGAEGAGSAECVLSSLTGNGAALCRPDRR